MTDDFDDSDAPSETCLSLGSWETSGWLRFAGEGAGSTTRTIDTRPQDAAKMTNVVDIGSQHKSVGWRDEEVLKENGEKSHNKIAMIWLHTQYS
jgi:hypothetical protein